MAKKNTPSARIISYQHFFSTADGLVVLKDLIRQHHFFEPGFHPEALELARMAGERNVICYILAMMNVQQEKIMELMKEEKDE